jgi:hypothetical protein
VSSLVVAVVGGLGSSALAVVEPEPLLRMTVEERKSTLVEEEVRKSAEGVEVYNSTREVEEEGLKRKQSMPCYKKLKPSAVVVVGLGLNYF